MNFLISFFCFAVLCWIFFLLILEEFFPFWLLSRACSHLYQLQELRKQSWKKLTGRQGQGFIFHSTLWWGNKLLQWFLLFLTFWSMFLMFFSGNIFQDVFVRQAFSGSFFGSLEVLLLKQHRNVFLVSPGKWKSNYSFFGGKTSP